MASWIVEELDTEENVDGTSKIVTSVNKLSEASWVEGRNPLTVSWVAMEDVTMEAMVALDIAANCSNWIIADRRVEQIGDWVASKNSNVALSNS